jgi:hypothetical protein
MKHLLAPATWPEFSFVIASVLYEAILDFDNARRQQGESI